MNAIQTYYSLEAIQSIASLTCLTKKIQNWGALGEVIGLVAGVAACHLSLDPKLPLAFASISFALMCSGKKVQNHFEPVKALTDKLELELKGFANEHKLELPTKVVNWCVSYNSCDRYEKMESFLHSFQGDVVFLEVNENQNSDLSIMVMLINTLTVEIDDNTYYLPQELEFKIDTKGNLTFPNPLKAPIMKKNDKPLMGLPFATRTRTPSSGKFISPYAQ